MVKLKVGLLSFVFAVTFPLIVNAGGAEYKADDIISHFSKSVDQGAARGICIGTAQECAGTPIVEKVKTFDLLVTFKVNSDALTSQARKNLSQFAEAIKDPRLSQASFSLEGHTDASGSESYNLGLSKRRAHSVATFLMAHGIAADRLTATGFGEFSPRSENPYAGVNRRVETRIKLQ